MTSFFRLRQIESPIHLLLKEWRTSVMSDLGFLAAKFRILPKKQTFGSRLTTMVLRKSQRTFEPFSHAHHADPRNFRCFFLDPQRLTFNRIVRILIPLLRLPHLDLPLTGRRGKLILNRWHAIEWKFAPMIPFLRFHSPTIARRDFCSLALVSSFFCQFSFTLPSGGDGFIVGVDGIVRAVRRDNGNRFWKRVSRRAIITHLQWIWNISLSLLRLSACPNASRKYWPRACRYLHWAFGSLSAPRSLAIPSEGLGTAGSTGIRPVLALSRHSIRSAMTISARIASLTQILVIWPEIGSFDGCRSSFEPGASIMELEMEIYPRERRKLHFVNQFMLFQFRQNESSNPHILMNNLALNSGIPELRAACKVRWHWRGNQRWLPGMEDRFDGAFVICWMSERANAPGKHVDESLILDVLNDEQSTQATVSIRAKFRRFWANQFSKELIICENFLETRVLTDRFQSQFFDVIVMFTNRAFAPSFGEGLFPPWNRW